MPVTETLPINAARCPAGLTAAAERPLPPLPPADERFLAFEQFESPGFEAVDVLRPVHDDHRTNDPEAPALVLIPGLGMDSRNYIKQLPLGAVADLHMPQAMNAAVAGEAGLGHFARHVEEYVLHRALDKRPGGFVIGGSSMGGAVSLRVCLRARVKPRGLVLIGSFANCAQLPYYQRLLAPLSWVLPIDFVKFAAKRLARRVTKIAGMTTEQIHWLISARIRRTHGYYGRAIMALTRQNQIPEARKLKLPTLVIHGTRDSVLPHSAGVEMAEAIPEAQFVSVEGAGHGLFFTHAETVNAAVAEFLQRI